MQRRGGGQRLVRQSSAVENGNGHGQPAGGQLCPGGGACLGAGSSSSSGYACGCIRKSSPLRRAFYSLRFSLRRAASRAGGQKGVVGAYLAACVFLLWGGLHVSALLRGGGGDAGGGAVEPMGGVERQHHQRGLLSAAEEAIVGYREEDVGPRLAYGIMVYQRKGYSPQKTLDQFGRMFNALYDEENT